MELEIEVKKLVAYIKSCGLQIPVRNPPPEHVGSIIADAVLQVGHRWKTHVGPRLVRMRNIYSNADTISGLSDLLKTRGAQELLNWHGDDELKRFRMTVRFFENEQVETFDNLHDWLESDNNRERLITKSSGSDKAGIPKIGNATADYYRVLVGLPDAVKVDRLVKKFLADADIEVKKYTYEQLRNIVQLAAKQLVKRPVDLDGAIWNYEEKRNKEKDEMEQDEGLMIPLPKDKIEQLEKLAQSEFGVNGATLAKFWIIEHLLGLRVQNFSDHMYPKSVASSTVKQLTIRGKVTEQKTGNSIWEIGRIGRDDIKLVTSAGGPLDIKTAEATFGAKWHQRTQGSRVLWIPIKLTIGSNEYDAIFHYKENNKHLWIGPPLNGGHFSLNQLLVPQGFNVGDVVKLKLQGNKIQIEK